MDQSTAPPEPLPAPEQPAPAKQPDPRRRRRIVVGWLIALALVVALVGGVVWLVQWSRSRAPRNPTVTPAEAANAERAAWESAMRKAGVEATFPTEPVELATLKPTGREPFSATFTAEELDALLSVYRYTPDDPAAAGAEVTDLTIEFPEPGRASIYGHISVDNTRYEVAAAADATYDGDRVLLAEQGAELRVEGFGVGGAQKQQAIAALDSYVNGLVDAAPGLEVDTAEITADGVAVTGFAPSKLENP